jgi:uncharacterized membrane protein (UPF0127 family)
VRNTLALVALLFAGGCRDRAGATPPEPTVTEPSAESGDRVRGPRVVLRPAGHPAVTVPVEVARTHETRMRGLMNRRELAAASGMLFVFAQTEHQAFWMRNTFLPLDMIFIESNRRVLGVVRNATPMTDDSREVEGDSQYVLEVNAGFAARNHIDRGTVVEFVNIPPALE